MAAHPMKRSASVHIDSMLTSTVLAAHATL
eukprot:COSAG02_NODE_68017_length_251_cov_1.032895_1_plen_29_part_10